MKVLLRSDYPPNPDNVPRSLVFGELVKAGADVIEHYHSDLYYDALWVEHKVVADVPFVYGVREYGTFISEGGGDMVKLAKEHNDEVWSCVVSQDSDGRWWMEMVSL